MAVVDTAVLGTALARHQMRLPSSLPVLHVFCITLGSGRMARPQRGSLAAANACPIWARPALTNTLASAGRRHLRLTTTGASRFDPRICCDRRHGLVNYRWGHMADMAATLHQDAVAGTLEGIWPHRLGCSLSSPSLSVSCR